MTAAKKPTRPTVPPQTRSPTRPPATAQRAAGTAAKPAPTQAVKTPKAPASPKLAIPAGQVKASKAPKADKPRKPKLVRDSFTIPKLEYTVIDELKARAARAGVPSKKSELLRAGIKALAAMGDTAFLAAVQAVPAIKTGRPAKA